MERSSQNGSLPVSDDLSDKPNAKSESPDDLAALKQNLDRCYSLCAFQKLQECLEECRNFELLFLRAYKQLPEDDKNFLLSSFASLYNTISSLPSFKHDDLVLSPLFANALKALSSKFRASNEQVGEAMHSSMPSPVRSAKAAPFANIHGSRLRNVMHPPKRGGSGINRAVRGEFARSYGGTRMSDSLPSDFTSSSKYLRKSAVSVEEFEASKNGRNEESKPAPLECGSFSLPLSYRLRGMRFKDWEIHVLAEVLDMTDVEADSCSLVKDLEVDQDLKSSMLNLLKQLNREGFHSTPLASLVGYRSLSRYQMLKKLAIDLECALLHVNAATVQLLSSSPECEEKLSRAIFSVGLKLQPSIIFLDFPDCIWEEAMEFRRNRSAGPETSEASQEQFVSHLMVQLERHVEVEAIGKVLLVVGCDTQTALPSRLLRGSFSMVSAPLGGENLQLAAKALKKSLNMPSFDENSLPNVEGSNVSLGDLIFSMISGCSGTGATHEFTPLVRSFLSSAELDFSVLSSALPFLE